MAQFEVNLSVNSLVSIKDSRLNDMCKSAWNDGVIFDDTEADDQGEYPGIEAFIESHKEWYSSLACELVEEAINSIYVGAGNGYDNGLLCGGELEGFVVEFGDHCINDIKEDWAMV